jgi:glycine/D-amino acid oxidase-like deaminating enzyme
VTAKPDNRIVDVDVAVVGGGIGGLWLLNRLQLAGYSALLLEKTALGSGQTIASQGMIHGGLKYALAGTLSGASEAIKQMPHIWQQCLEGSGEIDLRQTRRLSDDFYLWSAGNVGSRLVSFFASKSLRGRVEKVQRSAYPPLFANSSYKGSIYRLVDVVLDIPSLLHNLSCEHMPLIARADGLRWQADAQGVELLHCNEQLAVRARRYVVTAGEGTGDILSALASKQPAMQLRPLQQVMVKHKLPYPLYGHCIGASTSASPRLTVSTHPCQDGETVWYLGGDLATEGVALSSGQLIDHARQELAEIFPWLDFSAAQWATAVINRAEPLQQKLIKPDSAFASAAQGRANVIIAWPTKLSLAPDLARQVLTMLETDIQPQPARGLEHLNRLPKPAIATPIWDQVWA